MRQDSNKKAEFDAITEFISLVESIHPSQILQGVNACSLLGRKLEAAGLLNPSTFPLDLVAALQTSLYNGGLYSGSEEFQANLKQYAQVLWSVEQTLFESQDRLPEDIQPGQDTDIYLACENAQSHINRIAKGLGFDLNADSAKDAITAAWLNPVTAFLKRCNRGSVVSLWELAMAEKPPEPKPHEQRQTIAVPSFARSFNWRDALACAVALSGAVLLQVTCTGEAWKHFVGLLSVLMVAAPVWKMATRYAKRRALVPITQPTQ